MLSLRAASLALFALTLVLVPSVAHASGVLDLSSATFADALKSNPNGLLVEFFAPCAHTHAFIVERH